MSIQVVILAAGQGKRMHSDLPKVLHTLAGKPILEHVITTALTISPDKQPIIVYGHQGKILQDTFSHYPLVWVEQKDQLGTGHAILQALPLIADDDQVLILCGDVPLISEQTIKNLIDITPHHAIGMLTAHHHTPKGYGRIKRDHAKQVIGIVEEKDATQDERMLTEINPGIYLIPKPYLKKWLPSLNNQNAQNEYYLTDIVTHAVQEHMPIHTFLPSFTEEILGINDQSQLADLERFYQRQYAKKLMDQGATIRDPARLDIRGEVHIGRNVTIDVNVIMEGRVVIGNGCTIGPHVILRNVELGERTEVRAYSMIDGALIASDCIIGPFARIRPGTLLSQKAHVGNFVEIKNSEIGSNSKINHLSYVGDSHVGKEVNIGAGTITCNYDGVNKHKTTIADGAFIGSCTQLVAPVTIGQGATIGAGSTITKDAPSHKLTLSRVPQRTIEDWERPVKK